MRTSQINQHFIKSFLILIMFAAVLSSPSCDSRPNLPVAAVLTPDHILDVVEITKVKSIAMENTFVPKDLEKTNKNVLPVIHGYYMLQNSRVTMSIITYHGRFEIIITDPYSPGPFGGNDLPIIVHFERDLEKAFPNIFRECHRDFDRNLMDCAVNGHL